MLGSRLLLSIGILLGGCAVFDGYPERASELELRPADLESVSGAGAVIDCFAKTGAEALTCRNQIVALRLHAIDLKFAAFEAELFRQTRETGFAATLASLGLTGAGSLVTGGTANILAAAATALTGARSAFEKEILAEKTILAIHTAMRTNRKRILVRIRSGLKQGVADYPLGFALSDLEDYYHAGTVLGALINITESAGAVGQQADRDLLVISGYDTSPASDYLRQYLSIETVEPAEREARRDIIREQYQAAGIATEGRAVGDLITDPTLTETTARIARRLGWPG